MGEQAAQLYSNSVKLGHQVTVEFDPLFLNFESVCGRTASKLGARLLYDGITDIFLLIFVLRFDTRASKDTLSPRQPERLAAGIFRVHDRPIPLCGTDYCNIPLLDYAKSALLTR
jgi:hypothetical protein